MRKRIFQNEAIVVRLIALATFIGGLINLYSVVNDSLPERLDALLSFFPLEFLRLSRFLVLVAGFALVIASLNILKRKRRAYHLVIFLCVASIVFHLIKGIDYEEASVSLLLLVILFWSRREFSVRSRDFDFRHCFIGILTAFLIVFLYGAGGFCLLEEAEFNFSFHWRDAVWATLSIMSLLGDPNLIPQTSYAEWFARSIYILTFVAIAYAGFILFLPALYRFRTVPREQLRAAAIVRKHGRSSIDFFKFWKDKTYFFSQSGESFVAYRVAANTALALGDATGPESDRSKILREFAEFCREMDWEIAFHQTLPDDFAIYREQGFQKLKIGEEAVVDLAEFDISNKKYRNLQKTVRKFERGNFRFERIEPPISKAILEQMKRVSDGWLTLPCRRERTFSLGQFDRTYLRDTPVYAVYDCTDSMIAFVNRIPSFVAGETTFDLMRHLPAAPNGTMDYIFTKLILHSKEEGFRRLSLGMAPLSVFVESPNPTLEERAVQFFLERMDFLFSYTGLQHYKAKFTEIWEPRYLIYRSRLDLPQIGLALLRVAEFNNKLNENSSETSSESQTAKASLGRTFLRPVLLLPLAVLLSALAYFAWYELHPRPLPPAGKTQLVLRGVPQDIYFFPATRGERTGNQKVLFLPGDGGWGGLAITAAERIASEGYEVYALDTKRYLSGFTTDSGALSEPQVIDDLGEIARWTNLRWSERVTLVGWSEGAGLVVLGASAMNRAKLYNGAVVFGLPDTAELGWQTADDITYITGDDPDEPMFDVAKYLPQVAPLPVAVIRSSGDQFISQDAADKQFGLLNEPKKFEIVKAGNHAFSGNEEGLLDALCDALAWSNKNSP